MKIVKITILVIISFNTMLFSKSIYSVDELYISYSLWQVDVDGSIGSNITLQDDLDYDNTEYINNYQIGFNNSINGVPNIEIDYYKLFLSSTTDINSKTINNTVFNGEINSLTQYDKFDIILKGYLYIGMFKFDGGLQATLINFSQNIRELSGNENKIDLKINNLYAILPYISAQVDFPSIDLMLKIQGADFSLGDIRIRDYKAFIEYRFIKRVSLNYGYIYHSMETTNKSKTNKYNLDLNGQYLSLSLYF